MRTLTTIAALATLLSLTGCLGGASAVGSLPIWEPAGRWLIDQAAEAVGLDIEATGENAKLLIKQYFDDQLADLAHGTLDGNVIEMAFTSVKNGDRSRGLMTKARRNKDQATLILYDAAGEIADSIILVREETDDAR